MFLIRANNEVPSQQKRIVEGNQAMFLASKSSPQQNQGLFFLAANRPKIMVKPKQASKATCLALQRAQPALDEIFRFMTQIECLQM